MDSQRIIINLLKKETKLKNIQLEIPPNPSLGDYAFPCFILSKRLRKSPVDIATDLANKLKLPPLINQVKPIGPYLNFFINKDKLTESTLKTILKEKDKYGSQKNKKTIVIESPGPNTNKPLHLGHLRNIALGISLSNIYKKLGNKVTNVDIVNDRGIHICQSMLAYKKYGKNKVPNKKSDHFVGDFYTLYHKKLKENPELEKEAKQLLLDWESNDPNTLALWKKMNSWALQGIQETYKKMGVEIDKVYLESDNYKHGKKIVKEGLNKKIFYENKDSSVEVNLEPFNLGKKALLRSDGTSLYITQDLYVALKRFKDFKMDKMIYIVGSEQIYHFKVLFKILELLGHKFVKNYYHLPYGMVNLPHGKMKSREGTIVDADDIIEEITHLAKIETKKRHPKLTKKELEKRAETIGLGALKFFILKYDPLKDFTYNPKESLSFEGETGPYIQYTYARISSILKKTTIPKIANYSLLTHPLETKLITLLSNFPTVIEESSSKYKPSLITNYLIELSQAFNSLYTKLPILKAPTELKEARLQLILSVKQVLKIGLNLLGIQTLEQM